MLSRVPIKVSAPLLVGVPVLGVGLWLSLMWWSQSRDAVTDLADQNIEQIHELASNKVADVLSMPLRVCQMNAHLVRSGGLDPGDLESWRATLVEQSRAFDELSAIAWGGADGRSAWISRYADGSTYWALKDDGSAPTMDEWRIEPSGALAESSINTFDFDLFSRPWFTTPRDVGAPTWCEPFVWLGGSDSEGVTLGLSYGIPIDGPTGALLGIVDADFSLNDLSDFLRSIEIGKTGVAVLASRDGRLLAASFDTPIVDDDLERLAAADSPDRVVAAAAARFIGGGEDVLAQHTEITVDEETYLLRASRVGEEVGLDWTLTTIVPERDFLAQVERGFARSSITSLLAVLGTVVLGLVAARWLVAPLLTLVTAVRRIGQGDLDTRVEFRHAPEYQQLAREINEMTLGLQDRMRMRKSLSMAMEVQRNLLPSETPTVEGLDIAGHSTYCDETGGDYYDFLDVAGGEEGRAMLVVGDVMGHGIAAAMLMATARGILRSRCSAAGSLADFLNHLNGMLVEDTGGDRFMTMLLVTLHAPKGEMRWASAGHGPPIVYDTQSDSFPEYAQGGVPLGIIAEEDYDEHTERTLRPGMIILAATDGLWECKNENDKLFGMGRLRELLRVHADRSAEEISQTIREALARFRGPTQPDDDLTFVIVKIV